MKITARHLKACTVSRPFCIRTSQAVIEAWDNGIARLVDAGVTGTILLANMASVKGLSVSAVVVQARTKPPLGSSCGTNTFRCSWCTNNTLGEVLVRGA